MKWRRLGKIFDPTEHPLPPGCVDYAQAPQALVLDDRVRIYFSTRERGADGKVLSRVSFVELDPTLSQVLRTATHEVLPLGDLGTFDEHGIFPLNPLRDGDQLLAFVGGWSRRVSVPVDGAIGLALGQDGGETFRREGPGPILAATVNEPFMVGDPFVLRAEGLLHMWYIFGTRWIREPGTERLERVYKIAHATSVDGRAWSRDGACIVPDVLGPDECQAMPTVAWFEGAWHMYFCHREAFGFRADPSRAYRLGHCVSHDLRSWRRDDAAGGMERPATGWDAEMHCYPHLFTNRGKLYLLYNGNEFGRLGFGAAEAIEEASS